MFCLLLISSLSVDESLFNKLNIYQVMVSSFQDGDSGRGYRTGYGPSSHNGDLQGIINSLQYIKDLGFNAIWMTPIFDSSNGAGGALLQSTGYFATNYFKVDPKFGNEDTLRALVSKAHSLGLYVILDGVLGHHGGVRSASPNGNWPQGGNDPVSYPGSLPFYKEVVQYWINNFEIDGWRLDQCYQLYQNGHNYMKEIREAVYEVCDRRKSEGKQWGTLGYVVGEHWKGTDEINQQTYGQNGLVSAFDFPARYNMVQGAAQEESGAGGYGIQTFANIHRTPSEKGYPSNVFPNLFIDNHDLWRLGNLIRAKYGENQDSDRYWARHKMCIAALAVYTGPITLYYGDEVGDLVECWYGQGGACGGNTYGDNCARSDGHISGFNNRQQDLHDFTKKLMQARLEHPAMYRGTYGKTFNGNTYFNCKYDPQTGDKIVYVTTMNWDPTTVSYFVGGSQLVDLVTGERISGNGGTYQISLGTLGTRVFQVIENKNAYNNNKINDVVGFSSNGSATKEQKKSKNVFIVVGCVCAALVVAIAVAVALFVKFHKKEEISSVDDHDPLLQNENSAYTNLDK
ncbi:hypothetical protein M9Y10_027930 [Tritrichomonas musculus]|uniref:Glycosyl hydrolase family 13 catalytic domain-containing protein n=1 Tax=Tritrichomonas musculus TaxID=1915356 RepID=A0ABR2H4D7_9EUKA